MWSKMSKLSILKYLWIFLTILMAAGIWKSWMGCEETGQKCFDFMNFHNVLRKMPPPVIPQFLIHNHSFCSLRPISSEEALEEESILKSIAWPQTPSLSSNYTFNRTSSPACSKFTILPKMGGGQWYIGDQLEVRIIMKDYYCHPKTSGGDMLLASLKNRDLEAGVSGQVVDHYDGNYTAVFPLIWEGKAEVEVILVHPSEAVTVLHRLTSEHPDRIYFISSFDSQPVQDKPICNICLRPTKEPVCNFTDVNTGDPWFCLKPKNRNLNCSSRMDHSKGGFVQKLRQHEEKLFKKNLKTHILASGNSSVIVFPRPTGQPIMMSNKVKTGPSGFYYKGVWKSLGSTEVQQFDSATMTECLRGKTVHLYGDSTVRQWYEYLNEALTTLKNFDLPTLSQSGPLRAEDRTNNIVVTYRCHGPPIRFSKVRIQDLHYIANELDRINGGAHTVIVISVWSHFSTFPEEVYIRRLMSIRSAVLRLLARAPDTLVVIRTANPKALTLYETLTNSDWYSLQRDKALRLLFKGVNVRLVDAWEMTLAHQLPHKLHPQPPIIKNMMNVLLSYMCPKITEETHL